MHNLSKLTGEEKIELEKIQYETYIKLDMYVEALENSGKFNLDNGMFLKSGIDYYNNFKYIRSLEYNLILNKFINVFIIFS